MLTPKTAHRASRFHSNAAALVDSGKYRVGDDDDDAPPDGHGLLVGKLRALMATGLRILIVGCPAGTWEYQLQRHARLTFWPSTEFSVSDSTRVVPPEVGAVLITKMLSFDLSRNARSQAKARGLICPLENFSPGGVKRLLSEVLTDRRAVESPDAVFVAAPEVAMPKPSNVMTMPETLKPPSADEDDRDLVALLDDTIAGLQLVREKVARLAAEADSVRAQAHKLRLLKELLT